MGILNVAVLTNNRNIKILIILEQIYMWYLIFNFDSFRRLRFKVDTPSDLISETKVTSKTLWSDLWITSALK